MKGILGGAFDPPHIGHIILAMDAMEIIGLDEIMFIPCNIPPHKMKPIASFSERLEMIKIATSPYRFFKVSEIEGKRGGISYTVDTLRELNLKDAALLIGADQAEEFHLWKQPEKIIELCRVYVFKRKGYTPERGFDFNLIPSRLIEISSTEIRKRIKEKREVRHLLPPGVWEYILSNNLYL